MDSATERSIFGNATNPPGGVTTPSVTRARRWGGRPPGLARSSVVGSGLRASPHENGHGTLPTRRDDTVAVRLGGGRQGPQRTRTSKSRTMLGGPKRTGGAGLSRPRPRSRNADLDALLLRHRVIQQGVRHLTPAGVSPACQRVIGRRVNAKRGVPGTPYGIPVCALCRGVRAPSHPPGDGRVEGMHFTLGLRWVVWLRQINRLPTCQHPSPGSPAASSSPAEPSTGWSEKVTRNHLPPGRYCSPVDRHAPAPFPQSRLNASEHGHGIVLMYPRKWI